MDYLLKPFTATRFHEALARARERVEARAAPADGRIAVRCDGGVRLVGAEEVDWLAAADNYVVVHAGAEDHLVREPLAALAARLEPRGFARVHRGAAVNLSRVRRLSPLFAGDWELLLETGARVRLSRTHRERVLDRLGVT